MDEYCGGGDGGGYGDGDGKLRRLGLLMIDMVNSAILANVANCFFALMAWGLL